jgi:transcriptional regulator with XRE-family HTH domain
MDKKNKSKKTPALNAQIALGLQIRDLRKSRGMTLAGLAAGINRSVGWLSQIERGMSEVSISAMHEIAQALDVTVSWFFQEGKQASPDEAHLIVRKSNRKKFDFHGTGVHEEILSPSLSGQILLIESTFAPGTKTGDRDRKRQGEEAGLVVSGTLELHLDGKKFTLQAGDSFALPQTGPHRCFNPGQEPTVVLWITTPAAY